MLVVVVLFATVLLRFGIVLTVAYFILPATNSCPRCGTALSAIRHPVLHVLVPTIRHSWCLECGWSGVVRGGGLSRA
jgi:hypothetical protein